MLGKVPRRPWAALVGGLVLIATALPVTPVLAASPTPSPVVSPASALAAPASPLPAPPSAPPAQSQVGVDGRPRPELSSKHFDPARSKAVPTLDLRQELFDNPDGTHSLRVGTGPLQGLDETGKRGDLDLSLVTGVDGRLRPKRAATTVEIAPTSGATMASVELAPGMLVDLGIEGIKAGVSPIRTPGPLGERVSFDRALPNGTSLELQALGEGVETTYVIGSAAAAAGLVERLTLPAGYAARQASGAIEIVDASGAVVGDWLGGTAADSSSQQAVTDVGMKLVKVAGRVATATVQVDPVWLHDPARVYPVRIDPAVVRQASGSEFGTGATYVQNGSLGSPPPQWMGTELRAGTWDGGADDARSEIIYPIDGVPGHSRIVSATMWLYETWSYSCQARGLLVHNITAPWDGGTTTWANQPAFDPGTAGYTNVAAGYSGSCPAAWIGIDISGTVAAWYYGQLARWGVMVAAYDETDSYGWKRFAGAATANPPLLDITYESYGSNPVAINDADTQAPFATAQGFQGMTLMNQGTDAWPANGIYRISYHVYDSAGNLIKFDGVRTLMPTTVNPGGSIYLKSNIEALPMGNYILAWDMVEEGVAWFSSLGVPAVNRSYHSDQPPTQATLLGPANGATPVSLTPTLSASSSDPDGPHLQYLFRICTGSDAESGQCADSGWIDASSWTVPAGRLSWGVTYHWHTWVQDNAGPAGVVAPPSPFSYTPTLPLTQPAWSYGFNPYAAYYGGVNSAIGNYVYSNTDFAIPGVGPALQLVRTYNSMDTGTGGPGRWFGQGWTSTYEASLSNDTSGNAIVTYPDGRREFLVANGDGTYAPAFGFASGMVTVTVSGATFYDLKHRDQSIWRFRGSDGLLDSLTDAYGHRLQLTWSSTGVVIADQTGGRSLTVTFSTPLSQGGRVTSAVSSPVTVGGSQQQPKWTYTYDSNGQLASACDPTDTPSARVCTTYVNTGPGNRLASIVRPGGNTLVTLGYDSANRVSTRQDGMANTTTFTYSTLYRSTVMGDSPAAYLRLGEASGSTAADQVAGGPVGTYAGGVTLGQPGALVTDPDTAARFDGSTGYVSLPASSALNAAGPLTIEAWINKSSQTTGPIVEYNSGSGWGVHLWSFPTWDTLYANFVDTAGNSHTVQSPAGQVLTGAWYHVVATYDGTLGSLYVNGALVNQTTLGSFTPQTSYPVYLGRRPSDNPNEYFAGAEDEVAIYRGALTASQVQAHYAAAAEKTTTIKDALGHTTVETYSSLNQLLRHVNADSTARSFTFDQHGFLNSVTDENGNRTTYTNDAAGNVVQLQDGAGDVTYLTYDALNHLTMFRDPRSSGPTDNTFATTYTYDATGNLTAEQTPAGTRTWSYSAGTEAAVGGGTTPPNLVLTATDAMGHAATYGYDTSANLRHVVQPSGLVLDYAYDELGHQVSRTGTSDSYPSGLTTTSSYDLDGRMTGLTEPGVPNAIAGVTHQRRTALAYDRNGNLASVTVSDLAGGDASRKTAYGYDADDRQTSVTDPLNHTKTQTYDAVGNVVQQKDALGRTTQTTYTVRNLPATVKLLGFVDDPINPGTPRDVTLKTYTYDPGGRKVTATDALGRVQRRDYDAANRLTKVTQLAYHNRDGSTRDVVLETRAYDAAGHLTRRVEAGLRTTDSTYDAAGRLISTAVYAPADGPSGARTTSFTYDANGNVLSKTLAMGGATQQVLYGYDRDQGQRQNRVEVVNQGSPAAPNADQITTFGYDQRNLPTSMTEPRGNYGGANPADFSTNFTFDPSGRLATTTAPAVQAELGGTGVPGAPLAPMGATAVAGNGQATVSWTAPSSNGGSPLTSYTVTASPGGKAVTVSGSTVSATVTGLANGTAYTFTVAATNAQGTSTASAPSNQVTPAAPPAAPTGVTAVAGDAQATVSWTAPSSNNGSPIASYTVIASPGGQTASVGGTATNATVTGLADGTGYTFTVQAANVAGNGASSVASNSVTPSPSAGPSAPAYRSSATVTNGFTVSEPAGTASGDLLLASMEIDADPVTVTPPAGWTLLLDTVSGAGTSQVFHAQVWYKVAGASEPASYSWSVANSPYTDIAVVAYQNVNTAAPIDVSAGRDAGSTSQPSTSAITTGYADDLVATFFVEFNFGTYTAPSGMTERYDFDSLTADDAVQASAGAVGAKTATSTASGASSAQIVAVRASTAGGLSAPVGVTAAAGNGQATVSWTPPASNGGSTITGYTVTASPGGQTASAGGSATSAVVGGLTNGAAYTFTVSATNSAGTGPASTASNSVTPATAPGAPTGVTATAGNTQATVSWTPPATNGGAAVTGYTVTASPGGLAATVGAGSTSVTVPGLANGSSYTFTVAASNAMGTGAASAPSAAVTPAATSTVRPAVATGYDTFGEVTQVRDANGNLTAYAYDAAGESTGTAYPAYLTPGGQTINATESWQYDAAGNVVRWTDRRGQSTTYDYDMRNRLVRQTDPKLTGQAAAGTVRLTYDDASNQTSLVDQSGATQQWTYDDLNRPRTHAVLERVPAPTTAYVSTFDYDDLGRPTYEATPLNEVTTRQFDVLADTTQVTDPLGKVTSAAYDLAGRLISTTDPLQRTTQISYDEAGNRAQEQQLDATGTRLTYGNWFYDVAGNVVGASQNGGPQTTYTYDALGRVLQIQQPLTSTTSAAVGFAYDANGNVTRVSDGNGSPTLMTYNAWNQRESLIEPSTATYPNAADRTWTATYDAGGLPVSETQPGGTTLTTSYDELGRPLQVQGRLGGLTTTTGYSRDLVGNLLSATGTAGTQSFAYDDRGQVVSSSGVVGSSSFTYDGDGQLVGRTDAAGQTGFGYNPRGDLTSISEPLTGVQESLSYDDAGQLMHIAYGTAGPTRDYAYDGVGHLTSDAVKNASGTAVYQATYAYDANGNLTRKTLGGGQPGAGTDTYGYDLANRLTSWTDPSNNVASYAWDGAGNRTQAGSQTYTYDQRNRLLSGGGVTYMWSANGNLLSEAGSITTGYTYDALSRPTQVQQSAVPPFTGTTTTTYSYDGLDRVAARNGVAFTYSGLNGKASGDGTFNYTRDPVGLDVLAVGGAPGAPVGLAPALTVAGAHSDVEATVNATGTVTSATAYGPFGSVLGGSLSGQLGYQGEWTDPATGKVWMGSRWYDPTLGRFTSRDTIQPPLAVPVDANRFTYGADSPLVNVDPSGHCPGWMQGWGRACQFWNDPIGTYRNWRWPRPVRTPCLGGPSQYCPDDLGIPVTDQADLGSGSGGPSSGRSGSGGGGPAGLGGGGGYPNPVAVGETPAPPPPAVPRQPGGIYAGQIFLPPGATVPTPNQPAEAASNGAAAGPDSTCKGCGSLQSNAPLPGVFGMKLPTVGEGSDGSDRHGCDAQSAMSHPAEWLMYCLPGTNKQLNPDCLVPHAGGVQVWSCGAIPNFDNPFTKGLTQVEDPEGSGAGLGRGSDRSIEGSGTSYSSRGGTTSSTAARFGLNASETASFETIRPRIFKAGQLFYRSEAAGATRPGRFLGTRRVATKKGADSSYYLSRWSNPMEVLRTYRLNRDVTLPYGKVANGTRYQAFVPRPYDPSDLLDLVNEVRLK